MAIHSPRLWWVAVALLVWAPHAQTREFTHEDIRQALLSLVHMMRSSESKLERHELREKALGEQLKKMIVGLEKKALEPLISKITRLDDRLSNVETILLQKEERETASQKKIDEALENIQKTLQTLTTPGPKVAVDMDNNLPASDDALLRRLDATDAKIDAVKKEIKGLKSSLSKDSLRAMCFDVASDINPLERHISEAEKLLTKYETKLGEYNCTANKPPEDIQPRLDEVSQADEAWHNNMSEVMEQQKKEIVKIQRLLSDAEGMWKDLPRLADLHRSTNQTLEAVSLATQATVENNDKSVDTLVSKIRNMGDRLQSTNNDIQQSLTVSNTLVETMSKNFYDLVTDVKVLTNIKPMIVNTHDTALATKNRLEVGVMQIIQGLGGLIGDQMINMNTTFSSQLNSIQSAVMANQSMAMISLTSKMETQMSQVWRQIGIMHQQILFSKRVLSELDEYTHQYANSSSATMNNVKTEVGDITMKMDKLASDMNHGIGELSVTAQQFKLISKDLSHAFSNIQNDSKPKQDAGPGPHNIDTADKEI